MIQLLSWNCQGLGRALTVQRLGELVRSQAPSVIFLCETKQQSHRLNILRKKLGYHMGEVVNPTDSAAGGLALWWRLDVEVQVIFKCPNLLDSTITVKSEGILFRASWFYGPPYMQDKPQFWASMNNLATNDGHPWVCIGDFNEFLNNDEKEGGIP